MATLEQRLKAHTLIGLDTAIFIYHFEANVRYLALTSLILSGVHAGVQNAITSVITLMEITVHPWRLQSANIAREYEVLLANFPNLMLVDITRDIARRAAQLRADFNLRPADALQVATAVNLGATLFITNDRQHRRLMPLVEVAILEDHLD
jgi:predicted nucleic acid-binding protein